jgi:hypothetical protein
VVLDFICVVYMNDVHPSGLIHQSEWVTGRVGTFPSGEGLSTAMILLLIWLQLETKHCPSLISTEEKHSKVETLWFGCCFTPTDTEAY